MQNGKRVPWRSIGMLLLAVALLSAPLSAGTVNVLWYTGGVEANFGGEYSGALGTLAADAPGAPGGNTWNITQWSSGAMPAGSFNVLVVASPQGGWGTYPNYSALLSAASTITLGDRIMVTGQDADWHNINGPGAIPFDGPHGFLLDGINWAGSGSGLGLIALGADPNDYGFSLTGYSQSFGSTDNVQIPAAFASFPINTNLTSAGLSNWSTSAHDTFAIGDPAKWTGINVDGSGTDFVTIVTTATVSGGITSTPEPASLILFGLGLTAAVVLRRRRSA